MPISGEETSYGFRYDEDHTGAQMYHVSKADKRVAARIPMKFLNKKTAGKKGENKLQKSGKKNCGNRRDTEKRTKGEIGKNQKTEKNRNARTENPLQRAGIFLAEKTGLDQPGKRNKELCRELIGATTTQIGRDFGNRHYTTVMYACETISDQRMKDETLNQIISDLEQKLLHR